MKKPTLIYHDAYGNTYMVQNSLADTTEEFFDMARSVALAAGFHPDTINEIFNENEVEAKCISCGKTDQLRRLLKPRELLPKLQLLRRVQGAMRKARIAWRT